MKYLVYPYYDSIYPILQSTHEFLGDIDITHLVFPQAWKRKIDEKIINSNIQLSCKFEEEISAVEGVIISDVTKLDFMYSDIVKKIDYALNNGKQVMCYMRLSKDDLVRFNEKVDKFIYLYEEKCEIDISGYHYQSIECVAIGIGGLVRGLDDIVVIANLMKSFTQKGYKVITISTNAICGLIGGYQFPNEIFSKYVDDEEKVLALNKYFFDLYESTGCDIMLIQFPDSMMKYSDYCPEGYGIKPFIVSQAISIDYFVLITPIEQMDAEAFQMLNTMFEYRFDFSIDACCIEPKQIDVSVAQESERISFVSISKDFVSAYVEKLVSGTSNMIFIDMVDSTGYCDIAESCIQSLSDNIDKV